MVVMKTYGLILPYVRTCSLIQRTKFSRSGHQEDFCNIYFHKVDKIVSWKLLQGIEVKGSSHNIFTNVSIICENFVLLIRVSTA